MASSNTSNRERVHQSEVDEPKRKRIATKTNMQSICRHSQSGANLAPRGHLAMSGNVSVCHNCGVLLGLGE